MKKLIDWFKLTPAEYCNKYDAHKVKHWEETSGRGQFGKCSRCGERVHKPEWR